MMPAGPGGTTRFDPPAAPALRAGTVCHPADACRVEILLDAADTGGVFDLIEVLMEPGGRLAAHRHAFAEWFRVLEGEMQLLAPRGGRLRPLARFTAGQTCAVPPWAPHAIRNTTASPARFLAIGQPGVMSRYFGQPGTRAGDPLMPRSPRVLAEIAARYDIELITTSPGKAVRAGTPAETRAGESC